MSSEEGKIAQGDVVKAAAALGLIGGLLSAVQHSALAQHSNYVQSYGGIHSEGFSGGAHVNSMQPVSGAHFSHGSHASHGSHGSHASHASHGSHGSGT